MERRDFLKSAATTAGSFIVAFQMPKLGLGKAFAAEATEQTGSPNAFIQIAPDNSITLVINHLEMGQGINTSMAQLIAEELECDWKSIRCVSAPVAAVYNGPRGMQMTGGSSSLIGTYDPYRTIGASMRETLILAAAKKWGVPPSECQAQQGAVVHSVHGKLNYGELATAAASLPLLQHPKLKDPKNFKVIGKSVSRVDAREKSTGKAIFGIDVKMPGMLYALIARPPIVGAKLLEVDDRDAKAMKGVIDVIRMDNSVAVIAKNTFYAIRARAALNLKWDFQGKNNFSQESIMKDFRALAEKPGIQVDHRGNVEQAMTKATHSLTADYEFPYLAHAAMEPMNCTINFDGSKAELWSGHQMPTMDRGAAAKILGIDPEKVEVHTVYAGGSFGRRANKNSDYVTEAATLGKILKKTVKITWTREDDMTGGYYRPMNFHRAVIGLDAKGRLIAWNHKIVGHSVVAQSPLEGMIVKNGIEATVVEGVANTAYEIENFHCEAQRPASPVTTLWWRSVGHTHTAYVMETLIDELAHEMKQDALALRKQMLKKSPKHLAVLELLEKKSPWGKPAPHGHAYGLAIHESFNSVVGHVVEVSLSGADIQVHRVWSAVHCGRVINPDGAKTQVEGAFIYGLSAALHGRMAIKDGQVTTRNFDDYPVVRMNQSPRFDVFFVETDEHPTGLGEPGLPPAAPAIANALFKLTGKRIRNLPMSRSLT